MRRLGRVARTDRSVSTFHKVFPLCLLVAMVLGWLLGRELPSLSSWLSSANIVQVNLPVAVLLWFLILPTTLGINFAALRDISRKPKGIIVATAMTFSVAPFTMYGLAVLFFRYIFGGYLADSQRIEQYIAGAVLLGAAPDTAGVFVWNMLAVGDASFAVVQVALNDLLLVFLYGPIVTGLLASLSGVSVPYSLIYISVGVYVLVPLVAALLLRMTAPSLASKLELFLVSRAQFLSSLLLLCIVFLLFIMQSSTVSSHPVDVLVILVPLACQTLLISLIAYAVSYLLRLPYSIAAPTALVSASSFFELAVAVAVSLWGPSSGAVLLATVSVLEEVPLMLLLTRICRKTRLLVSRRHKDHALRVSIHCMPDTPPTASFVAAALLNSLGGLSLTGVALLDGCEHPLTPPTDTSQHGDSRDLVALLGLHEAVDAEDLIACLHGDGIYDLHAVEVAVAGSIPPPSSAAAAAVAATDICVKITTKKKDDGDPFRNWASSVDDKTVVWRIAEVWSGSSEHHHRQLQLLIHEIRRHVQSLLRTHLWTRPRHEWHHALEEAEVLAEAHHRSGSAFSSRSSTRELRT